MKHVRLPAILAGYILSINVAAQQVDWLQSSAVGWEMNPGMPQHTLASAPGYLVGMRTVDVSHNYSIGVYGSVALERLDPATGSAMWTCMLQDSVSIDAAVVDPNGIAYFAGRFQGDQLEICDGTTIQSIGGSVFTENAFLIAWHLEAGVLVWAKNLTAEIGGWHHVTALAVDQNGSLWYTMVDFFEGLIIRVDANGNTQETRTITNCKTIGAISIDPWGGMYVSGGADDTGFSFAGTTPEVDFNYAMFVLRYRPDGSAGFAVFAEDITFQHPNVVATSDGHAYLGGNVFAATNWGGFPVNGADWVSASFLAKLDSTGTFHWLVESDPPGGDLTGDVEAAQGPCIAVDEANNVYFTGSLRGLVDWGNSVVSDGLTIGTRTLTVVAFDPAGNPQWAITSQPDASVWAQTITASAETDAVHFASHITSEFTMGGHTTNIGGSQAALLGRISGLVTSIDHVESNPGLLVWPNPVADALYLENGNNSPVAADLFNSAGQRVQSMIIQPGRNTIGMAGLSQGLYLLRMADGGSLRVVKE